MSGAQTHRELLRLLGPAAALSLPGLGRLRWPGCSRPAALISTTRRRVFAASPVQRAHLSFSLSDPWRRAGVNKSMEVEV